MQQRRLLWLLQRVCSSRGDPASHFAAPGDRQTRQSQSKQQLCSSSWKGRSKVLCRSSRTSNCRSLCVHPPAPARRNAALHRVCPQPDPLLRASHPCLPAGSQRRGCSDAAPLPIAAHLPPGAAAGAAQPRPGRSSAGEAAERLCFLF